MSKMGISVIGSYRGAQIFEAIGISSDLVDKCFAGTSSKIEGIGFSEIAIETLTRHRQAFSQGRYPKRTPSSSWATPGSTGSGVRANSMRLRRRSSRIFIPLLNRTSRRITKLTRTRSEQFGQILCATFWNRIPTGRPAIPLDEVEPIEEIRRRFTTAGMSLGALSPEAHECLAIAMNQIGGKSNSGEGGEDPERFHRRPNGDWPNSAIKQVAAGRFGVTAAYLATAKEIEIKMAQGAKPGEGGQLPGHKVTELIARLRKSTPGVASSRRRRIMTSIRSRIWLN